ncbi:leucyl/phenylalanyl-tRNA--protein transferase [Cypionkella psychrotolerans]|uniref:leucyl/phenylalanyl-tRNA--protein transferase n=1 Tax=Cypionkella psychrotolerans TaxID=1678131 RepID=UPI0006B67CFE|nr:leucyl/phenylalanyl-tRNA--protein transferase [Cypionkella psychrotolerans]
MTQILTPEILLRAYGIGIFPMAESRDNPEIHWVDPKRRGVFPLDGFHISRSLAKHILTADYRISVNEAFAEVVAGCADRPETWINTEITELYTALHQMGFAHSLEVWRGEALIGGVYGVTLGAAFFGESMFSRQTNASKTALAYLTHRLRAGGFQLFDTQFLTPHLASLGAVEIPRAEYQRRLTAAVQGQASFTPAGYQPLPPSVVAGSALGS